MYQVLIETSQLILKENTPVWLKLRLCFVSLQKECVEEHEMPPLDHPRVRGVTGYHIRTGKHNLTYSDWKWFLDFTDTLLK